MRKVLLAIVAVTLLAMASCSGEGTPVAPVEGDRLPGAQSSHGCWGL